MSYKLFLDDERGIDDTWVLVRGYDDFVKVITERGLPDWIAFDHDLGNYWDDAEQMDRFNPDAKTGYDCAKWLVENNLVPKQFSVHSWNISGGYRIGMLLEENGSTAVVSPAPHSTNYKPKR